MVHRKEDIMECSSFNDRLSFNHFQPLLDIRIGVLYCIVLLWRYLYHAAVAITADNQMKAKNARSTLEYHSTAERIHPDTSLIPRTEKRNTDTHNRRYVRSLLN